MENGTEKRLYKNGDWHFNDWNVMHLKTLITKDQEESNTPDEDLGSVGWRTILCCIMFGFLTWYCEGPMGQEVEDIIVYCPSSKVTSC